MDLQKAFDTVDHKILLAKLSHCGICVNSNWFKSCLSNHNQYVTINYFGSDLAAINCGIPQGSFLGPLLFLLKFWKVYHFVHDTYLLCISNSIKKQNKLVNADLSI